MDNVSSIRDLLCDAAEREGVTVPFHWKDLVLVLPACRSLHDIQGTGTDGDLISGLH